MMDLNSNRWKMAALNNNVHTRLYICNQMIIRYIQICIINGMDNTKSDSGCIVKIINSYVYCYQAYDDVRTSDSNMLLCKVMSFH